jgi:MoxR-like ATPase
MQKPNSALAIRISRGINLILCHEVGQPSWPASARRNNRLANGVSIGGNFLAAWSLIVKPVATFVDKTIQEDAGLLAETGGTAVSRPSLPSAGSPRAQALSPRAIYQKVTASIESVMRGQSGAIRRLLAALASGGHVLLEDYPGTGKTTLAKALARSIDARFKRIQFTPDLLPSDILGVSVFNQRDQTFSFHEGPVFADILLADEINRASPRTQSALLEAMAENQVSVDGQRRALGRLFFVVATQNPIEFRGTYPLPEAQMDRFAMQFDLGYIGPADEVAVLTAQNDGHPIEKLAPCAGLEDIVRLREGAQNVRMSDELKHYVVRLVAATRQAPGVQLGASPRASIALMKAAQALALFDGQEFVSPEHICEVATPVIAHRLVLEPQAKFSGMTSRQVVDDILRRVPIPA